MDRVSKEKRSYIMSRIRGKNTVLEKKLFTELKKRGIRFRKHYKKLPGTPDAVILERKIAIFVDGDFWHGWQYPKWKHKLSKFWQEKIERNRIRDRVNFSKLRLMGWKVVRIWEHNMKMGRVRFWLRY